LRPGAHDLFDGPVAKASNRASQRGSYFDSVVDRISDAVLLGGCAYYLTAQHRGQLVLLPIGIMTATFMISYQRSKAESLGLAAKGGLMERAERMVVAGRGPARHPDLRPRAVAVVGAHHHDGPRPILAGVADRRQTRTPGRGARDATFSTPDVCAEGRAARLATKRGLQRCESRLFKSVGAVAESLPESVDVWVGRHISMAIGRRKSNSRSNLRDNLRHALFPSGSARANDDDVEFVDRFVDRAFSSYGQYWAESAKLPGHWPSRPSSTTVSASPKESSTSKSPKLGAWARSSRCRTSAVGSGAGRSCPRLGLGMTCVAEELEPPELFEWFKAKRESIGIKIEPLDAHAGTVLLANLKDGGVVGLLCDRDIQDNGIEVEFFGERVTIPGGPATLALRTGRDAGRGGVLHGPGRRSLRRRHAADYGRT
jgi:hypothetical protein